MGETEGEAGLAIIQENKHKYARTTLTKHEEIQQQYQRRLNNLEKVRGTQ